MDFLSQLTGSFAQPAAENPTVALVEAAYRHHGLDWRYINCEVAPERLGDAVRGARAMGWRGFNCSIPHKIAVIEHLDGLAESAAHHRRGELRGGARRRADRREHRRQGVRGIAARRRAAAGRPRGGARAPAARRGRSRSRRRWPGPSHDHHRQPHPPLPARSSARLVASRTPSAADFRPWQGAFAVPEGTDILINATSIGLYPDASMPPVVPEYAVAGDARRRRHPEPAAHPVPGSWRESRGCRTIDGHGMLVNQAVTGIAYWTGIRVDGSVMRAKLAELFGG